MSAWGEGPGAITADGCAVDFYALLSGVEESQVIHARIPAHSTVLDLGCGTGRIADPLCELGHRVTGVDNSPEMLARLQQAETICSSIEDLRLSRSFDVVLLISNLVNHPDQQVRQKFLATAARHVASDGRLLVQWEPPGFFKAVAVGETYTRTVGDLTTELAVHGFDGDLLTATVSYTAGADRWSHHFTTRRLDLPTLNQALGDVGLALHEQFGPDDSWIEATPNTASPIA